MHNAYPQSLQDWFFEAVDGVDITEPDTVADLGSCSSFKMGFDGCGVVAPPAPRVPKGWRTTKTATADQATKTSGSWWS